VEFVYLFLPDMAEYLRRDSLEFLDKEVFTDIASGDRHEVDLLVKARFRGHGAAFFLVHIESQSSPGKNFPRRMFAYFARLHEEYGLPVFPIVLYSHGKPLRREPDRYVVDFPKFRVLDFAFRTIQLNRLNWRDYLRNPNPVASALMTKMLIAPEERPRVKLECLRMLATLKLDKAKSALIATFMESYLKLTAAESIVYNRGLKVLKKPEREAVMQLTNEWIEQGKKEGRQEVFLEQLRFRFGSVPREIEKRMVALSDARTRQFGKAIFAFQTMSDVRDWFASVKK
jgi:hypothetical protein